jgi:hypothetical protein
MILEFGVPGMNIEEKNAKKSENDEGEEERRNGEGALAGRMVRPL